MIRLTWKHDLTILALSLLVGLFIWQGSRALSPVHPSVQNTGYSRLPNNVAAFFEQMHQDLGKSKGIISAQPSRICFLDNNVDVQEYRYAYGTLWYNNDPVVSSVQSFSFEYRDRLGQLLTYTGQDPSHIEMVGYTSRLNLNNKDVLLNSKVKVIPVTYN